MAGIRAPRVCASLPTQFSIFPCFKGGSADGTWTNCCPSGFAWSGSLREGPVEAALCRTGHPGGQGRRRMRRSNLHGRDRFPAEIISDAVRSSAVRFGRSRRSASIYRTRSWVRLPYVFHATLWMSSRACCLSPSRAAHRPCFGAFDAPGTARKGFVNRCLSGCTSWLRRVSRLAALFGT